MFKPPKRSSSGASLVGTPRRNDGPLSGVEESPHVDDDGERIDADVAIALPESGNDDIATARRAGLGALATRILSGRRRKKEEDGLPTLSSLPLQDLPTVSQDRHQREERGEHDYMEHDWSLADLQAKLDIHLDLTNLEKSPGLTYQEAQRRLEQYGPNQLTPPLTKPDWLRFIEKFLDPFMLLLELAAVLSFILYAIQPQNRSNLYVASVLIFIITLTCFMAYYQEGQSLKLMSSFESMMSDEAMVSK